MKPGPAERKVRKEIIKYVEAGLELVVACSGGADSIALTDALWRLQPEHGYKLTVMHVEHGIRGQEALNDAEFVKRFCAERGLKFVCRHVKAAEYAEQQGLSLEDAARKLRYKELFDCADINNSAYVVTAHQADDQAETVLMQLLRGSGTAGLGGMQIQSGRIMRPLLFVRRSELEEYCRECNLQFCHDSTNDDLRYTRNRIRLELMPYLEAKFNPQLKKTLGQTAQLLRADDVFASCAAQKFYADHVKKQPEGVICWTDALNTAFEAVRTRVIRMMWEQVACGGELGFEHIRSVLALAVNGSSGKNIALPGKTAAVYSYGSLCICKKQALKDDIPTDGKFAVSLNTSELSGKEAEIVLPDGRKLVLSVSTTQGKLTANSAAVPLDMAGEKITVRTRSSGDRFYPYGSSGSKKLKDYFIDTKVPRGMRDKKILVTAGNNVLWIIGGRQAGWKAGNTEKWLLMRLAGRKDAENEGKHC